MRKPRGYTEKSDTDLEQIAFDEGGVIERGAGWRTLDLGKGRRYCAVDAECSSLEVFS